MGMGDGLYSSTSICFSEKLFLFTNYILLGAASSCIFLTLSLRLIPSLCGFFLILLHILTIAAAVTGCAASGAASSSKWYYYAAHMAATILTAIFQGSVSVLIFTNTANFLGSLKSYVRAEDGAIILRLAGGLCALIFCLDWVVLVLSFFSKFYAYVYNGRSAKVQQHQEAEEDVKNWPWPFQV